MLDWFYEGTKTPIEMNDNVKFEGNDGPIRSQIVEIQEDNNCVIVKSKGIEYRVHVEDISPLDSTFKKMYLARRRQAQPEISSPEDLKDYILSLSPRSVYNEMPYIVDDWRQMSKGLFSDSGELDDFVDDVMSAAGWTDMFSNWYEVEEAPMVNTEGYDTDQGYMGGLNSDADW